jgi:hypothetical protein
MEDATFEIAWFSIVVGWEFVMYMVDKDMTVGIVEFSWEI